METQIETTFETEDVGLAAYLKMKGMQLKTFEVGKEGNNKIRFFFIDAKNECKDLRIKFLNSECKKFDSEVRDLKRLMRK